MSIFRSSRSRRLGRQAWRLAVGATVVLTTAVTGTLLSAQAVDLEAPRTAVLAKSPKYSWKPSAIAAAPDGTTLYAGSFNYVHAIKAGTLRELGAFRVGTGWVRDLHVDHTGSIVYATSDDNRFYALSTKDALPIWSVPVGTGPKGFGLTPNEQRAYVANFDSGTVSVVDLLKHAVIAEIPVGPYPWDVAIQNDGDRAYAAMRAGTTIPIIDTFTNTVLQNLDVGSRTSSIAISLDGSRIYLGTDGADGLTVINAANGGKEAFIPVGKEITSLATSRFGQLYAREKTTRRVVEISLIDYSVKTVATGSPTRTADPEQIALSPDSRTLYYTMFPNQAVGSLRVPFAPPAKPARVRAAGRVGSAQVSWSAPASVGSAPVILEYQVRSIPEQGTCTTARRSCTVKGLKPGKAYKFAVRARTSVGWGKWAESAKIRIPVPVRRPSAPPRPVSTPPPPIITPTGS